MGFTCRTFDLELVKLDVADCIHDTEGTQGSGQWCLVVLCHIKGEGGHQWCCS